MKIYKQDPRPTFFGQDARCYESTAYNAVACLTLMAWLIYFSVGTFVVSKLQYLNRTTPFIVNEGFATMLQLFKFFSVLLILTNYGTSADTVFTIVKLVILSLLLLVMTVYILMKKFALHPFARFLHTVGIMVLFVVNVSILAWIGASRNEFK